MAKTIPPSFQFYPADWLKSDKITLMTPAEEGAYIRLLAYDWTNEGLPDDDEKLAILSRLGTKGWKASSSTLRCCFTLCDGKLRNSRLLLERKKQKEWSNKCRRAGKLSGKARREKRLGNELPFNGSCDLVRTKRELNRTLPLPLPLQSSIKNKKEIERERTDDPISEIPTEGQARASSIPEDPEIHYLWKVYHDETVCRNSSVPWRVFYQNAAGAIANGYTTDDLEKKLVDWRGQGGSATAPSWEIWKDELAGAKDTTPVKEYRYDDEGKLVELGGE